MNTLIVAAGRSKRFGPANKLLTQVGGRPLIVVSTARILAATRGPVRLVVGHQSRRIIAALARYGVLPHPRLSIVRARASAAGLATSLDTALESAPRIDSAVTVYLADMPYVEPAVDHLLGRAVRAGYPIARVAAADQPGHPVRIHRRVLTSVAGPGRLARAARNQRAATFYRRVSTRAVADVDTRQMIRSLI